MTSTSQPAPTSLFVPEDGNSQIPSFGNWQLSQCGVSQRKQCINASMLCFGSFPGQSLRLHASSDITSAQITVWRLMQNTEINYVRSHVESHRMLPYSSPTPGIGECRCCGTPLRSYQLPPHCCRVPRTGSSAGKSSHGHMTTLPTLDIIGFSCMHFTSAATVTKIQSLLNTTEASEEGCERVQVGGAKETSK